MRVMLFFKLYLGQGWKSKLKHSFIFKIRALILGFWPDSLMIYNLKGWKHKKLLNDYARCTRTSLINYPDTLIIDDKLIFERYFSDSLTSIAHIYNNRIIATNNSNLSERLELTQLLENRAKLILKPRKGGGGQGIKILVKENDVYRIGNNIYSTDDFFNQILYFHDYLIYSFFEQTGFSNEIYSPTLNTIRILTIIDKSSGEPVMIRALHRFGTSKSFPVDNWSAGGLCCDIDPCSGMLSTGHTFPFEKKIISHSSHPDSGKKIEGLTVPGWQDIVSHVINLHRKVPFIRYIGWDVALSDGRVHLVEANSNSDVNLFQVHSPLLQEARIRSIFKDYNII
jgi:hypothetical protein